MLVVYGHATRHRRAGRRRRHGSDSERQRGPEASRAARLRASGPRRSVVPVIGDAAPCHWPAARDPWGASDVVRARGSRLVREVVEGWSSRRREGATVEEIEGEHGRSDRRRCHRGNRGVRRLPVMARRANRYAHRSARRACHGGSGPGRRRSATRRDRPDSGRHDRDARPGCTGTRAKSPVRVPGVGHRQCGSRSGIAVPGPPDGSAVLLPPADRAGTIGVEDGCTFKSAGGELGPHSRARATVSSRP